jgi:type VI protein secretion system component VasK
MTEQLVTTARFYRILLLIYALVVVLGAGILAVVAWYDTASGLWVRVGSAILILTTILVAGMALIWRRRIWLPHPEAEARRVLRAGLKRLHRGFRARARSLDSRNAPSSRALFVTPIREDENGLCSMAELGYASFGSAMEFDGIRLSTWSAQTAVAYRFELGADAALSLDQLGYVLQLLRKDNPALPLNAIHIELDLARLGDDAEGARQRRVTNQIASHAVTVLRLDLPVHLSLVGLENAPDLVRAAVLTGGIGEQAMFGGFLDETAEDNEMAIDALFADMAARFDAARLVALQKQLAPAFCSSLVTAPLQLGLLLARLRPAFREVTAAMSPRTRPLRIHSVFFLGTAPTERIVDPLAQLSAQRFFGLPAALAESGRVPESVVTKRYAGQVANALHLEAFRVRPNEAALWQSRLRSFAVTLLLAAVVAFAAVAAYRDHQTFAPLNAQMEARFDTYFAAVAEIDPGADGLVARVLLLGDLRNGLAAYDAAEGVALPRASWSQEHVYRAHYEAELVGGFQMALQDYIEKDLFAFNALQDGVSLFALALIEVQFHSDQSAHGETLTRHFLTELANQGEIGAEFTAAFRGILADLFALNQPQVLDRDSELNRVVARTLRGLDAAEMLYRTMLRNPGLSQRVDLRAFAGPRFGEVFEPTGPAQSYLVQKAFTRDGFEQIFTQGELARTRDQIRNYEVLIGEMNAAQANTLLRRVVDHYTADYIASWTSFVENLRLRDAASLGEAHLLMTSLGNTFENPVTRLVRSLRENTMLAQADQPSAAGASDAAAEPLGGVATPARAETGTELSDASGRRAAQQIAQSFRPYLAPAALGEDARTEFDVLVTYARDVAQWIEAATTAANGTGKFLFEEYAAGDKATPIAKIYQFAITSDLDIIRNFGTGLASVLDRAAIAFVEDYINAAWRTEIWLPYGNLIASSFPFDVYSPSDLSLDIFTQLFEPINGDIRKFRQTYLARFEGPAGGFKPAATFLPFRRVQMSSQAGSALMRADDLGQALFREGKPGLTFQLRVGYMDPGLSRLVITSGLTLHSYSHGPVIWSQQAWPMTGLADSGLRLRLYNRSRLVLDEAAGGAWSWFRLAQAGQRAVNPSLNLAEARFQSGGLETMLQFSNTGSARPFDPVFFTGLTLPEEIFP